VSAGCRLCMMNSLISCECLASPCSIQAPPVQQEVGSGSMSVLVRCDTAATSKAAPALFDQLDKALKGGEGDDLVAKTKASFQGSRHTACCVPYVCS